FDVDLTGIQGTDKNIIVKYKNELEFYEIHHTGGNIYFEKHLPPDGHTQKLATEIYYQLLNNTTYHFKIKVDNNKYKISIVDGGNETLLFDVTDPDPSYTGKVGLRAGTGAVFPTEVWFDNVVVTEIPEAPPTPLPSLDVPDLKQYDLAWGNQIYDHLNATIRQFGCALTSAAMILQYHGHSWADPATLNNWLKSQSDGYLRNGLLNWLAVSRYTFLNKSDISPTLEYRRIAPTNNNLLYELENNRPAILKEPGHFIVAKSQTSDSFGINDPAYADRTTLASYDNTFSAINSYLPTDTNLSYILLAIDGENTVKVYEPNGTEIIGFTFTEEPLIDDIGGSEKSGEILTIFQYPIPADGEYKIEVTGPLGSYTLDSYLYDIDGLVTTDSYQGLTKDGQVDTFSLSFGGESPSTVPIVTIDTLIDDLNNAYSQKLITKRAIYLSLKYQFQGVKKLLQKNKTTSAKRRLSYIKSSIARSTPRYIKQPASDILRKNIEILISSL
ncbi:MAG: C39 family peptidase, partial [bacterium]